MRSLPNCLMSIFVALAVLGQTHAIGIRNPDLASATADPAATVRFDLYQGYFMVVHGSAGPLKNLNFFLDTGTIDSTFDSRIAKKLNLHDREPASIIIVGGKVPAEVATLPSLELGPLQLSNLNVITTDLSFFQRALPIHIDAIIGLDVLGQAPFVIDYSARVIRFGAAPDLPVSIPLRMDQGLAVFDAEIDHNPVHLLFDTGASALVLFSRAKPKSPSAKADAVLGPEAIGTFESKQVFLNSLRMGPKEFRKEPALLTSNPKPSQLDFDGLMSPAALGISRVSVDLNRGVMTFSR
jgi:predicted aspartyl protease